MKNRFLNKATGMKLFLILLLICALVLPACQQSVPPVQTEPVSSQIQLSTEPSSQSETTVDILSTATPQLRDELESGAVRPGQSGGSQQTNPNVAQGRLEVHFIDVGQADAALVLCNGKAMLIDGGNADDSSRMYTYLKNKGVSHLDYVIGTHAHEDHIGGIPGALNYATVGTVYCPVRSYSTKAFSNFVKAVENRGSTITIPSVGTSFSLGGATCTVLAVNTETSDTNNTSIVLRITYGATSFLFTGDAEYAVEQAMINRGSAQHATVLKVGHHGSSSSTSYNFLRNVMPSYAVISVGKGNTYGHPTENVLSRLRDADVKTFRTDMQGDIICISNGGSVSFTVSRNANADTFGGIGGNSTQPTEPEITPEETTQQPTTNNPVSDHYVLNTNSLKFHKATCENADKIGKNNREDYYGDRSELIEQGYDPCGFCNP